MSKRRKPDRKPAARPPLDEHAVRARLLKALVMNSLQHPKSKRRKSGRKPAARLPFEYDAKFGKILEILVIESGLRLIERASEVFVEFGNQQFHQGTDPSWYAHHVNLELLVQELRTKHIPGYAKQQAKYEAAHQKWTAAIRRGKKAGPAPKFIPPAIIRDY